MTKRELVAVLAMGVALFVGGYRYAAAIYGEDIAELREDYASRAQQLEEKYREKERATAQSLVDAWEARDAALARASDLSGDLDRVRLEADAARRRLSGTTSDTCKLERERLARCSGLVVRGAELVNLKTVESTLSQIRRRRARGTSGLWPSSP